MAPRAKPSSALGTKAQPESRALQAWVDRNWTSTRTATAATCYSESAKSCLNVPEVPVHYASDEQVDGRIIIRDNFAALFEKNPCCSPSARTPARSAT
jgi:hypothetical protein